MCTDCVCSVAGDCVFVMAMVRFDELSCPHHSCPQGLMPSTLKTTRCAKPIAGRLCDAVGGIMAVSRCRAPDEGRLLTPNECGAH